MQIDQHRSRPLMLERLIHPDGGLIRERVTEPAMRQERRGHQRPQQITEGICRHRVGRCVEVCGGDHVAGAVVSVVCDVTKSVGDVQDQIRRWVKVETGDLSLGLTKGGGVR